MLNQSNSSFITAYLKYFNIKIKTTVYGDILFTKKRYKKYLKEDYAVNTLVHDNPNAKHA